MQLANTKYILTVCLTTRLFSYPAMSSSSNQYQDFHEQIKGHVYCWPRPEVASWMVNGTWAQMVAYVIAYKVVHGSSPKPLNRCPSGLNGQPESSVHPDHHGVRPEQIFIDSLFNVSLQRFAVFEIYCCWGKKVMILIPTQWFSLTDALTHSFSEAHLPGGEFWHTFDSFSES